ncbi:sugar phosphate isomerase/epimerase [Paenibacillus sp. CGMCC 1.18879]|uniref:sugar phosphate isomerase/epimerase n=1 Tax=Paenibacillus sp. CGMCC 1.18879 TaxID=2834466 RepID=UPI001CA8A9F8|nr:sugar phosphate isomerase/epimerase [Paenibacillus sp. CGMCC 1.18879]MBY9079727.1 sugar phosphate isomerase/epimerase [Paenibacillus sp. CGMCC 1.18879]
MRNFMIGQYGAFDYEKYHRDYKEAFFGIEACLFNKDEDTLNLIKESKARGFEIGVHFPLHAGRSSLRDALFLSPENRVRDEALEFIQQELDYLVRVKPRYVLFHYPKPVILDDRVDWSSWRFADDKEYAYESNYSIDEFIEKSEYLFQWLSVKSDEYQFIPVLEFDALNKYVYQTDFLEELLHKYSKIKLCLDTGRLHLQDKIDPFFDSRQVVRKYVKYAEVIHLWNLQYTDKIEKYHYPVLPEQRPEKGWAPIEEYLNIIRKENRDVKIQFEHRSDFLTDDDLERCYMWVDEIINA